MSKKYYRLLRPQSAPKTGEEPEFTTKGVVRRRMCKSRRFCFGKVVQI